MHKKTALLLTLGIFLPVLLFGQGETANWYFGNNAGLRFNNDGTTSALNDGRLDTFEGCTTISNDLGDLLFYTDGITVYDRNHNIMQNGLGLYGDPSSTQSALIVPKPLDPTIFYIFTVDTTTSENDPDFGLNYSVVDITLNNGNGAITQKNIRLLSDCSEKIAAVVKDCADESIWVVTLASQFGSDSFNTYYAYEVNTSGVLVSPVKSTFSTLRITDPRGYLKFSSDGRKMASANMSFGLQVFDFDASTGIVSNMLQLDIANPNNHPYGLEFSPNNRFLYTHSSNLNEEESIHFSSLIQFDLEAAHISDSQVEIDYNRIYRGALQLGVNGKIYRTIALDYQTGTPFLGVINNPNEKGQAANYRHNAIALDNNGTQGLPPFIQSFFNKTDLIANADGTTSSSATICSGNSFRLQADDIPGATYLWEKDGNPMSNPDNFFFHIDTSESIDSGRYSLEIILPDPNDCPIIGESLIEVLELPQNHDLYLIQCDVDSDNAQDGLTVFDLRQIEIPPDYTYYFYESIVDRENDDPIDDFSAYRNTVPFDQTLYYKVLNEGGCENFGELQLRVNPIHFTDPTHNTLYSCDGNVDDDILSATFDLQHFIAENYPDNEIQFYDNLDDAALERNPLPYDLTSETRTIYARVESGNQCENILDLSLVVNPAPRFKLDNAYELCTDNPFLTIEGPTGFDFYHWVRTDASGLRSISNMQTVQITEIGDYMLEVGYLYDNSGILESCVGSMDFQVIPSNRAVIDNIAVQDFSANNTILLEVSGDGDYEFSLDGIDYSDSNFFSGVKPGIATIRIRDKNGCGVIEQEISVIGYPKFFTPNGDGYNDQWNLIGLTADLQIGSLVSIFDKYGKKLTEFGPDNKGWDGKYNTRPLPASDYWFKISLNDGRIFKGHFALKR